MGHSNASSGGGSACGNASHEPDTASQTDLAAQPHTDPAVPGVVQQEDPGPGSNEGQPENVSFPQSSSAQLSTMVSPFSTSFPQSIPEDTLLEEVDQPPSGQHSSAGRVDDTETPRILPNRGLDATDLSRLPDPRLTPSSSLSDTDKRHSVSSLASFTSGRLVPSSAVSVTGSDPGAAAPHSRPTPKPSIRSMQSEASASTAPDSSPSSSLQSGGHQYSSSRDGQQGSSDAPKRTSGSRADIQRQQLNRSRSRAQRRFSGSYGQSSQSPASDRVPNQKEKEEGQSRAPKLVLTCRVVTEYVLIPNQ